MKQNKGFTLIEMLIVIAIIAILSAVVLTGVSGFQASARDTARIGDLKNIQDYLELYYNKCGFFPGTFSSGSCVSGTPNQSWSDLANTMSAAGVTNQFPSDPLSASGKSFCYGVNSSGGQDYVLGAVLESSNSALNANNEGAMPSDITGWSIGSSSCQATVGNSTNRIYIISS